MLLNTPQPIAQFANLFKIMWEVHFQSLVFYYNDGVFNIKAGAVAQLVKKDNLLSQASESLILMMWRRELENLSFCDDEENDTDAAALLWA